MAITPASGAVVIPSLLEKISDSTEGHFSAGDLKTNRFTYCNANFPLINSKKEVQVLVSSPLLTFTSIYFTFDQKFLSKNVKSGGTWRVRIFNPRASGVAMAPLITADAKCD